MEYMPALNCRVINVKVLKAIQVPRERPVQKVKQGSRELLDRLAKKERPEFRVLLARKVNRIAYTVQIRPYFANELDIKIS